MQTFKSSVFFFFFWCKLGENPLILYVFDVKQFPLKGFIFLPVYFCLIACFMVFMNAMGPFYLTHDLSLNGHCGGLNFG